MITGELKSKIDRIWDAFWSGGISNPLEVIEQITYLLFLRRLDDLQTLEENKADAARQADRAAHLPDGQGPRAPYEDLRWSRFKNFDPAEMFDGRRRAGLPVPARRSAATARPTRTT